MFLKLKLQATFAALLVMRKVHMPTALKLRDVVLEDFYQWVSSTIDEPQVSFMNLGYLPAEGETLELNPDEELNRSAIQLYHRVAGAVDLTGKEVLEVGSGRGGGAEQLHRRLKAKRVVGLDRSDQAVAFCTRHHATDGLEFRQGTAEQLPFPDASFDAVVNVESSHCYNPVESFFAEVHRVLRPGGHFLFADFRAAGDGIAKLQEQLDAAGFDRVDEETITAPVLAALARDDAEKRAQILRRLPGVRNVLMRKMLATFVAAKETTFHQRFTSGDWQYDRYVLRRRDGPPGTER